MQIRRFTRRETLGRAGRAGILAMALPPSAFARSARSRGPLNLEQRRTLRAAVARIVPASHPGDWSAADVGADEYIVHLLAGPGRIYAGGPYRSRFDRFQRLSRVKRIGWSREIRKLRRLYASGLRQLDKLAGGDFSRAPGPVQDALLTKLDDAGSAFFGALYNHTLEGVYSHPAYGGNRDYRAWKAFGYAGDVHGVRFPHVGPADAPWNRYGGYAPEEMIRPGKTRSHP